MLTIHVWNTEIEEGLSSSTVESGYLAHAPDETTTEIYVLDSGTYGLASSAILALIYALVI